MLVLTQSNVRAAIGMAEAMELVELALVEHAAGRTDIPLRIRLNVPEAHARCLFMPGYLPGLRSLGQKIIVEFPGNDALGLPVVTGLFTLLDERTGLALAVMDALYLTVLRTGAVTGAALKRLAPRGARTAALLGPGGQAPGQLQALHAVLPGLQDVRVWGRRRERAEALVRQAGEQGVSLPLRVVDKAEAAVRGAEIVIASTSAHQPVVEDAWVGPGALVCAIGAPGPDMQEVASGVVGRADKVVADTRAGVLAASGELLRPIAQGLLDPARVWDLGAVIAGERPGREREDELIFFKSTGFAALDLAVGKEVVRRARAAGLGVDVDLLG
ncbi:MAG: ornithine cyclodeaminase family protein [Chloroflexi bacterium]|nr:ornithine cyclodeaminase family protein [Chloroflexota bacterium]